MAIRICHVISGLRRGGAETTLLRLIRGLPDERYSHRVVALVRGELDGELRSAGAEVLTLGLRASRLHRSVKLPFHTRDWRPDIVHGWMYHGNLAALISCLGYRRSVVLWSIRHSPQSLRDLSISTRIALKLGAVLSPLPSMVLFNSRTGLDGHIELGYRPRRFEVVSNGFDTQVFRPDHSDRWAVRAEWDIADSAIVIGLVARYHPIKDHRTFLEAAEQLVVDHQDVHFVLVGPDVDASHEELRQYAKRIGVERVHLLGNRQDVTRVLCGLDILTLTSRAEGFPNVLGEAMATGLPCVSTDVGDARVLLGHTGIMVPVADTHALVDAWRRLILAGASHRAVIGRKARDRIRQFYSLENMILKYESIYQELAPWADQ